MSKILNLYKRLLEEDGRFVDEVFASEIYKPGLPQLTIVDIGAYEGEFSFYCLPMATKIYAVEPDPQPYKTMENRVKEFQFEDVMEIFNIAISGKSEERRFLPSGTGGSRLFTDQSTEDTILVQSLTLNDFLKQNKIEEVDILKIDVEGSELEIFNAEDFKEASCKIKTIVGEMHGGQEGIQKRLEDLGYKFTTLPTCFTAKK